MKRFLLISVALCALVVTSCSSNDDVKEISGTLLFNEIGSHSFNINAENIQATITMASPNKEEIFIFENVTLNRTVQYTAKIGVGNASKIKTELLNNLVLMYEAQSNKNMQSIANNGFVKIDWIGYDE